MARNDVVNVDGSINWDNVGKVTDNAAQLAQMVYILTGLDETGTTDVTTTIQNKLNAIASSGGGTLRLSSGKYQITSLSIPTGVSIEGDYPFDNANRKGTYFYCVDTVNPAITLNSATQIKNVGFYYPNQYWDSTNAKPGIAYPASIYVNLDAIRMLIENIMFINPYIAIDANRHHEFLVIHNVQGYAIYQGLICDYTTDIDRYTTVHFNYNTIKNVGNYPNWGEFGSWTRSNGTAFTMMRTDWGVMTDCFCWGYRTGFYLTSSPNGSVAGLHINKCGADACGIGLKMDAGTGVHIVDCFFTHFNNFTANTAMDDYAIDIQGGTDVTITKCRFWGCDRQLIHLNCNTTRVEGNSFYDYGNQAVTNNVDYRAIVLDIGTHIISNNIFNGQTKSRVFGILIHTAINALIAQGNSFRDFVSACIQTSSSTPNIIIGSNSYYNCTGGTVGITSTDYINFNNKNISTSGNMTATTVTGTSVVATDLLLNANTSSQAGNNSIFIESNVLKFKDSAGTVHTINIT